MATATAARRRAQKMDEDDEPQGTPKAAQSAPAPLPEVQQRFLKHVERTRGRQDTEVVEFCEWLKGQQQEEPGVLPDDEGPGVGGGGGRDPVPPPPPPPPPGTGG